MPIDNTALIMNIRGLRRILKAGDDVSKEITDTIAEINADVDHSQQWKNQRLEKARNIKNAELRKLGTDAMGMIEKIEKQITARREAFDHRDPDFQSALTTLQVYGKTCPYEVQQSIIESLKGNYKGLRSIKAAFEAYELPTDSITKTIGILDSMGVSEAGAVSEFAAYAVSDLADSNQWRAGGIRSMLDRYEAALNIDSSTNPILARLDAVINDPNTRQSVKERAESWRNGHAEALEDDDAHAMKTTESMLNTWQQSGEKP